jgi:hypothetical protein
VNNSMVDFGRAFRAASATAFFASSAFRVLNLLVSYIRGIPIGVVAFTPLSAKKSEECHDRRRYSNV